MGGDNNVHPLSGPSAITKRRMRAVGDLTDFFSPSRHVGQVTMHLSPYRMNPMKGFFVDQLKRYKRTFGRQLSMMAPAAVFLGGIIAFVNHGVHQQKLHHYH